MEPSVESLVRWVSEATERNPGELPVFPAVAARLVDLLEQPDAEMSEVGNLVLQDPVISAQLLRTANSAMYGGATPVETVSQAVIRLGFRETAQVAMAAACRALFSVEDRAELEVFPEVWRALWHDALVCAYGARLLAREMKRGNPERVFLDGMFRNVGGLLVLKIVAKGLVQGRLRRQPAAGVLERAMDALHTRLGAHFLRSCYVPDHIQYAAAHHHDLDLPFDADHMDLHVVRFADGLCQKLGIAPFATRQLGPLAEESAAQLQIEAARLEYFELQLEELANQLERLV